MAGILKKYGIEECRIHLEDKSLDTTQNAYFTLKMILDKFTEDGEEADVTLVTADYHMPRASWLFRNVAYAMKMKVIWTLLEVPSERNEELSKNLTQESRILQYFGITGLANVSRMTGCTKDIELEDISTPKKELAQKERQLALASE